MPKKKKKLKDKLKASILIETGTFKTVLTQGMSNLGIPSSKVLQNGEKGTGPHIMVFLPDAMLLVLRHGKWLPEGTGLA